MTAEYTIDRQQCIVFTTLSGALKLDECLAHHQKLANSSDFNPALRELIDGSAVESISLNPKALLSLSKSCPFGSYARRAIYTSDTPLHYYIARMFQAFSGGKHGEIKVFKDKAKALSWLGFH